MATQIHFATNRKQLPRTNPIDFGGDTHSPTSSSPSKLIFGNANVQSTTMFASVDDVRGFTIRRDDVTLQSQVEAQREWSSSFGSGHDILIYVHGYATTFHDGQKEAAAIKDVFGSSSGEERTIVLFSWPSNGSSTEYIGDRSKAANAGDALSELLSLVATTRASAGARSGSVHLLAQSMGNFTLRAGIQAAVSNAFPSVSLDEVVLTAADEDADTFSKASKLRPLPPLARRVSVLHNSNDGILDALESPKLGLNGPVSSGSIPSNVSSIDCSSLVSSRDLLGRHVYFLLSPGVRTKISSALAGR